MARIVIRDAHLADIPEIAEIERASFSDPWSASSFRSLIGLPSTWFAVAERSGRVIGYSVMMIAADEAELGNIAVADGDRRHGVGRLLLDAAVEAAGELGVVSIYLEVRDSNDAARSLYAARGFEEVGRRRGYYRRPVEDAIVLRWRAEQGNG